MAKLPGHVADGVVVKLANWNDYAGRYRFPAVAWRLGVPISRVALEPSSPGVVFRSRLTAARPADPDPEQERRHLRIRHRRADERAENRRCPGYQAARRKPVAHLGVLGKYQQLFALQCVGR